MIRDKSWRDLWELVEAMRKEGSPVKTLVLVSGDVHHSYCMTAQSSGSGTAEARIVQITCLGLRRPFARTFEVMARRAVGLTCRSMSASTGSCRFLHKNGTGSPDLVLYENAAAMVDVGMGPEVGVVVTYLTGSADVAKQMKHIFEYHVGAGVPEERRGSGRRLGIFQVSAARL